MNASYLQCPVQRVGLSSAFHFHATSYYNKSTRNAIGDVTEGAPASRSWEGFSLYNRERGETQEPFREGVGNEQRSRSVNPAFYLPGGFLHQPLLIFHLSSDLSSLPSPLSHCQISFSPTEPTSRKCQDHLRQFTVSIASYLEQSYKKYCLAFVIKTLPDYRNICRKKSL